MPILLSSAVVPALGALLTALFLLPSPAHAYLDAATGSMIIQAVVAAVAGGLLVFRTQWRRLKSLLGLGGEESKSDTADAPRS